VANIEGADADVIITGDASCLTQMNGGLSRADSDKRVVHIADFLAGGLKQAEGQNAEG
jgi:L-lactate dehydrogenase complex protein LldE